MPQDIATARLQQAIADFRARAPRDLPPGAMKLLAQAEEALTGSTPDKASAGQRAAIEASGGAGVPYPMAAKGADKPSPGQRAAAGVKEQIAQEIAARRR